MTPMFFDGWNGILRILIVGTLAYAGLILSLRVSGKRTLSKMNAFDLIVTVALGSTLATVLLSEKVALAEGMTAFLLLIGLQFLITWSSVRSQRVERLVKAEPTLVFYEGRFLNHVLRGQRVTEAEVRAAVRQQGIGSMEEVAAVVLETDGSLNVISAGDGARFTALQNVGRPL